MSCEGVGQPAAGSQVACGIRLATMLIPPPACLEPAGPAAAPAQAAAAAGQQHLSVGGHNCSTIVHHNVAVVQPLRVRPLLLEAAHREPEAVRGSQLTVPLHEGPLQRLCYRQRLRHGGSTRGLARHQERAIQHVQQHTAANKHEERRLHVCMAGRHAPGPTSVKLLPRKDTFSGRKSILQPRAAASCSRAQGAGSGCVLTHRPAARQCSSPEPLPPAMCPPWPAD